MSQALAHPLGSTDFIAGRLANTAVAWTAKTNYMFCGVVVQPKHVAVTTSSTTIDGIEQHAHTASFQWVCFCLWRIRSVLLLTTTEHWHTTRHLSKGKYRASALEFCRYSSEKRQRRLQSMCTLQTTNKGWLNKYCTACQSTRRNVSMLLNWKVEAQKVVCFSFIYILTSKC